MIPVLKWKRRRKLEIQRHSGESCKAESEIGLMYRQGKVYQDMISATGM